MSLVAIVNAHDALAALEGNRGRNLHDLFRAWQALPAFRHVDWADCTLLVRPRRRGHLLWSTGSARIDPFPQIRIMRGYMPADARAVLLHEMAHIAAWGQDDCDHGPIWRACFAAACADATGCYPLSRNARANGLTAAVQALI